MPIDLGIVINLAAIAVMAWCFYSMQQLSPKIPGGVVGKTWRLLRWLVGLFLLGYLATPFFPQLPPELINVLVALIFFFGAVYVLVTVRLIYRIIAVLSS
ncbi:MAG: hypothetical protein MUC86_05895 [Burkholderiaceae bacterium]|jgi:hypothetical protein|nr:hypothetical protein [Burkholderiaceae bacterium]